MDVHSRFSSCPASHGAEGRLRGHWRLSSSRHPGVAMFVDVVVVVEQGY